MRHAFEIAKQCTRLLGTERGVVHWRDKSCSPAQATDRKSLLMPAGTQASKLRECC